MAITQSGTSITFNDSTTQTTAFTGPITGGRGQAFTANGTFTVPAGVTAVKVTVVGGGGGSYNGGYSTNGGAGGTSSFGAYISATGGGGGLFGSSSGSAGSVTSYDVKYISSAGFPMPTGSCTSISVGGSAGPNGLFGAGGNVYGYNTTPYAAIGYGSGGSPSASGSGGAGGGGGAGYKYITGLTPSGTVTVTVGAGGTVDTRGGFANTGAAGIVIIEW